MADTTFIESAGRILHSIFRRLEVEDSDGNLEREWRLLNQLLNHMTGVETLVSDSNRELFNHTKRRIRYAF